MFDIFYSGTKPNLFVHERLADSIEHAQHLSRTRYFWWINYLCDYKNWNWIWEPPPWQSQYTHVWPSEHHQWSGTYLVPKHGSIQYCFQSQPIATRSRREDFVVSIDKVDFDWTWHPHPHDPPYIYVFGNQWWPAEVMPTVEYHVTGASQRKYMTDPVAQLPQRYSSEWHALADCDWDRSWRPDPGDPPYIYVFGNQHWSAEVMPTVEYHVPGAKDRKYIHWPHARIKEDMSRWTVPSGADVTHIDFSWRPDPGEPPYIYQFATQHQKTGGPVYTVPGATEVKYMEHVTVPVHNQTVPVVEIDHLDGHAGNIINTVKTVRYFDNYRDTLLRIARNLKGHYEWIWICSSVCDYTNFDFSWHPEKWQSTMLHVFASDEQKFGDTFYMHVPTFAERAENKALLEWYAVNFVPKIKVPRRPMPVIVHDQDSHVAVVQQANFAGPVATFTNHDCATGNLATVPLWRAETKTIVPVSAGAQTVIVPREALPTIKTQLYDYPYIDRTKIFLKSAPLDVVFIENGEINAQQNLLQLKASLSRSPNNTNQLHVVSGINGRVAAYHAAASVSTTAWFFAVFAKLEVTGNFDWSWQPDRMQQPKHYIFHARNPVNGLEYGHQAMIAYNRNLVLANTGHGLDFTLDQSHEVVPMLSGTAYYANSQWMAWRTAFREVIKLKASLPNIESEYRLNKWLSHGVDDSIAPYSQYGAQDAVEYYDSVKGDFAELKKSYEWEWLASYAFMRRNLTVDQ